MKAAVVREFGKPLRIEEVAVRRPGTNQVLVKSPPAVFVTPTSTPLTGTGP